MKIKLANTLALAIIFPITSSAAFYPLANDLSIPNGIYNTSPINILDVNLNIILSSGSCEIGDYSGCTLDDVDNDINWKDKFKPEIKVHFQAGDFPDDGSTSNATLRQRGGYSRFGSQKSYRIKLDSKNSLWRGERKLQLNKHPWDLVKVRNKLSFDVMKNIPHLPSLDSQFVKLQMGSKNYGIFTHIEKIDKYFLIKRGWDKDSPLYKVQGFLFNDSSAYDVDADGKPIDLEAFEESLEIKRGKDHTKLAEMIAAVNNPNNNFQTDVLEKYFNMNNYLSWIAVNILTGNIDVANYNHYLYNPKGTDDFYFLPWDYSDTWGIEEQPDNIAEGLTWDKRLYNPQHLWDSNFHRRFLMQPNAMDLITEAVNHIKNNYFTAAKIQPLLDQYRSAIYTTLLTPPVEDDSNDSPDFYELPMILTTELTEVEEIIAKYNSTYNSLLGSVQKSYDHFIAEKESPMTFRLKTPTFSNNNSIINLSWHAAFDPQGDAVSYDIDISTTPDFQAGTIKRSITGITSNTFSTYWNHPAGDYFYRAVVRDSGGHWQNARDRYVTNIGQENETEYYNAFDFEAPHGTGTPPPPPATLNPALILLLF